MKFYIESKLIYVLKKMYWKKNSIFNTFYGIENRARLKIYPKLFKN